MNRRVRNFWADRARRAALDELRRAYALRAAEVACFKQAVLDEPCDADLEFDLKAVLHNLAADVRLYFERACPGEDDPSHRAFAEVIGDVSRQLRLEERRHILRMRAASRPLFEVLGPFSRAAEEAV